MEKNKYNLQEKIIQDLMDLMVDAVNYEDLAKRIVARFADLLNAELCTLWRQIEDSGEDILILGAGVGFERRPGEELPTYRLKWNAKSNREIEGVTAWIAVRNQLCISNSYEDLAENPNSPWYGSHRGKWDNLQFMAGDVRKSFRSLLGLPICYGENGDLVGVIKAENSRKASGFDNHDLKLAMRLLPFVSIALQSMTKREQHEQDRQRVLKELTTALPIVDLATFHQQVVTKTAQLLNADMCSLWLVNNDRTRLVLAANYGVREKTGVPEYPLNWDTADDGDINGLTSWVAIRKKPFFAAKFEDLKRCPAHRGKWDPIQWEGKPEEEFGGLYAVPLLRAGADEPIGVLKIENSAGKHAFDDVDKTTFDVMAEFIALAIELGSRLRSDIVFDFFHLLKQPTTNAVMAFQSLHEELLRLEPRPNRIEERLEMIARNLESVRIWAMNVYGLASTSHEAFGGVPSKTNLYDLFVGIIKEMQRLFPEFRCNISLHLKESVVELTPLERKKVEVIFFNILDNSFKYSMGERDIQANAKFEQGKIIVSIDDRGQGIAPEDIPRIFEPYFSKPAPKSPESMGLGLSTVKKLLDELGWTPNVKSRLGEGTCFSIIIPKSEGGQQEWKTNQKETKK